MRRLITRLLLPFRGIEIGPLTEDDVDPRVPQPDVREKGGSGVRWSDLVTEMEAEHDAVRAA